MLSIGNISFNSQFTFAADGTVSLTTTPVPIGGGTITGPVVIKTNTAPSLPAALAGTLLQLASSDSTNTRITIDGFGAGGAGYVSMRRARNTAAAPAALASDDSFGAIEGWGYGATGYSTGARATIVFRTTQVWTDAAQGSAILFAVTPNNTIAQGEAMRIADSGNVGIGTTGPLSRLDVNGGVAIGTYAGTVAAPTNGLAVAGNVTIGTTTATAKVTISANVSALQPPPASAILHLSAANGVTTRVLFDSYGSNSNVYLRRANGTAAAPTALAANDSIGLIGGIGYGASAYSSNPMVYLAYYASEAWTATAQGSLMQFVTTPNGSVIPAERMRIDSTGNVGIGTTGPAYPLEVAGIIGSTHGAPSFYLTETDVAADNKIWRLGPANGTLFLQTLDDAKVSAQPAFLFTRIGISITSAALYTNNTERLRIDSSGNVGIGTTLPGAKLTVNANAANLPTPIAGAVAQFAGADGGSNVITFDAFGAASGGSYLIARRANNTAGSPTALAQNDAIVSLAGRGYGATGYSASTRVAINYYTSQAWTDAAQGTFITFLTTPANTVATAEAMRLNDSGLGIGIAPLARLHLARAGALNFAIQDTTQTADEKIWDFYVNGSSFVGRAINDGYNLGGNWVAVNRTGYVIDLVAHYGTTHSFYNSSTGTYQYATLTGTANQGALLGIGGQATTGDVYLAIGGGRSGSGTAFIDFVGDTTNPAYGLRIIRDNTGANATSRILHKGTGSLRVQAEGVANIEFYTTNTLRAVVYANGAFSVGTTPSNSWTFNVLSTGITTLSNAIAHFSNKNNTAGDNVVLVSGGPNSSDLTTKLLTFYDSGVVTVQGAITRNGAAAVAYGTTSDARLKENIRPTATGLDALRQIEVEDFNFIGEDRTQQGLVAQALHEVYPVAVYVGDDDDLKNPWMIDYGRLTPLLIAGMQQQQAIIEDLSRRLAALEVQGHA